MYIMDFLLGSTHKQEQNHEQLNYIYRGKKMDKGRIYEIQIEIDHLYNEINGLKERILELNQELDEIITKQKC